MIARNKDGYSQAFGEWRHDFLRENFGWVLPMVIFGAWVLDRGHLPHREALDEPEPGNPGRARMTAAGPAAAHSRGQRAGRPPPALDPRRATHRGRGPRPRLRRARARWYLTKWFRQMLFVLTSPTEAFWELKRTGDWGSVAFMLTLAVASRMLLMQFMSFHYIFQAVDRTNWNLERIMQQRHLHLHPGDDQLHLQRQPRGHLRRAGGDPHRPPLHHLVPRPLRHRHDLLRRGGPEGHLPSRRRSPSRRSSCSPGRRRSILTNATTLSERSLYYAVSWIINFWVIYLFFTHIRIIHDFTFKRTIATYALSLITVILIWALAALVFALTSNTYEFFYELFYELTTR